MAVGAVKLLVNGWGTVRDATANLDKTLMNSLYFVRDAFVWTSGLNNLQEIDRKHHKNYQRMTRDLYASAAAIPNDGDKALKQKSNWDAQQAFVKNSAMELSVLGAKWFALDQLLFKSLLPQSGLELVLSIGSQVKNSKMLQDIAASATEAANGIWQSAANWIPSNENESSYWSYVPPVAVATYATYKGWKGLNKTFKIINDRPHFTPPAEQSKNRSKNRKALVWHGGQLALGAAVATTIVGVDKLAYVLPSLAMYKCGSALINKGKNTGKDVLFGGLGAAYLVYDISKFALSTTSELKADAVKTEASKLATDSAKLVKEFTGLAENVTQEAARQAADIATQLADAATRIANDADRLAGIDDSHPAATVLLCTAAGLSALCALRNFIKIKTDNPQNRLNNLIKAFACFSANRGLGYIWPNATVKAADEMVVEAVKSAASILWYTGSNLTSFARNVSGGLWSFARKNPPASIATGVGAIATYYVAEGAYGLVMGKNVKKNAIKMLSGLTVIGGGCGYLVYNSVGSSS